MAKNETKFPTNPQNKDRKPGRENKREPQERDNSAKTIDIRRVTKVVKGGRTMRFSATVVWGDKNGNVGVGIGKAAEVPTALSKAQAAAKNNVISVARIGTTIPYTVVGIFGRGKVLLMPAAVGTGVIAGGAVRAVLEAAGIKDIRTKSLGSNNSINCAKATIEGLKLLKSARQVAQARGITIEQMLSNDDIAAIKKQEADAAEMIAAQQKAEEEAAAVQAE